jgi:hypothetical protein
MYNIIAVNIPLAMQSRAEKKLDALKQQKADLDAKIRKIEQEKQREIRKAKHKRAGIIGALVQEKIEAGEEVHFKEEGDLIAFLDATLTRKADRGAFGLSTTAPACHPLVPLTAEEKEQQQPIPPQNLVIPSSSDSPTTKQKSTKKRLNTSSQNSMAKEFNL